MTLEVFKSSYGYYNLRTIDGNPTEEMRTYLKQNGYYWSSNNNCWYPHTSTAKQANETFVETFRQKFFDPAAQEQKSFGQELFEHEQRKAEWREAHGLSSNHEHSEEKLSVDERITYLENLVKELQEERTKDKAKIASLESELSNKIDESDIDYELEQQQIDEESEWEKENTLTEEEEQEIVEQEEIPDTTILNNSEVMNKLGEIMDAVAREEEPEAERDFSESQTKEENVEVEVSSEELALAKSVLPTSQYVNTLRLSQGEEGNFFKQKIKDIAEVVQNAPKLYETDGAEQHTIVLRYFHPTGTETLVTEIGEEGEAFGFQCLNGDYEMAEFGYLDLNEIKNIRMMEIDYHVEKGMTVERWLYKEHPDMFPQYAKYAKQPEEKTPLDIAKETGNDVEAISESLNQQKRYYYNPYSQEYFTIAFENNDWHYVFYDKDYNVLSDDAGITPDSPKNISEAIDTILEMRYHIDSFDPDGMSKSEYEAAREEKEHYLSKNWTIWTDVQGFEEIVELKRKAEQEKENKTLFLKDVLKNDEELKQSALVNNRQDFANAYYDKLTKILIKEYDNDKSDFVRNLLDSDKTKKEIMGEYIDEVYDTLKLEERRKITNKTYDFFINDAANLDLGIGAEIEPITGLTAEKAALKYAELKDKGLSPYIGINIPGDFVFDDKEGQGAGIFTEVNGHPSFYMGDNFVKDLKEYDEHAKNVIAAYKELYEMTDKYILGVQKPVFLFEKENELSEKKEYDFTKPIIISERFAIDFVNHGYKENTVRFIDRKYKQITTGQYVVSTIANRNGNSGLILDMGITDWTVDAESMRKATEICRYYRDNDITITSNYEEGQEIKVEADNSSEIISKENTLNKLNNPDSFKYLDDDETKFRLDYYLSIEELESLGIPDLDNIKSHPNYKDFRTGFVIYTDSKQLKAAVTPKENFYSDFIELSVPDELKQELIAILENVIENRIKTHEIDSLEENEIETEYKIMQEISKKLTPDEISLNLAKYKESLVYAQEKSKESWEDFYARNSTGFDTPQTVDEFRKSYEHNKKQFEYDVKKYTGWIKALEEVQTVAPLSNSPRLTEEQKKEIYETQLKWEEYLNLTEPRIKQYGEAEMRKLSRENAKEFADEFIKAYESQDEDRLLRMNNAWGINHISESGFDDERDIPRSTFIKFFTDGYNISVETVRNGIKAHCKKQVIENSPVNELNTKLASNIDWSKFTKEAFNKTKADMINNHDGEMYGAINVGQLCFELVPQDMGDRMELFTNIYYPELYSRYGEDADGVKYDTATGLEIDSETFTKMSYEEFKEYFIKTVLPSSLDNDLTERALKPTEDWNTIWQKMNEEDNYSYMFPEGFFKDSKELNYYEAEYEGTFNFESDGICQVVSGTKKTLEKIASDYGYELHPDYLYHKHDLDLDDRAAVHDLAFRNQDLKPLFDKDNNSRNSQEQDLSFVGKSFYEWAASNPNDERKLEYIITSGNKTVSRFDESIEITPQLMSSLRNSDFVKADYSEDKITVTLDFINDSYVLNQKELESIDTRNSIESEKLTSKKDIKAIREQCREILKKPDSEITETDKTILAQYEGAGGLNEVNRTNAGILNEFYTPNNLVNKVWQIVDAYAPNAKTVLEPSAGVGKFANNRPNNEFTMHELDETSARINKILHPEANIIQGAYQKQFFDEGERVRLSSYQQPKYDVVIGNPPYGKYNDKYKGLGEGKEFDRYEEYFISKGLEALKDENSIMAFVVPSGFLNNASDKQKEIIASKGKLIDAYRLPVGTFPTTDVGTDIIIMTSWEKDRNEIDLKNQLVGVKAHAQLTNERLKKRQENYLNILSSGEWFKQHPEKILGEVKTRTNRFGKIEEYVAVHEGLTVQDELNKIDSMLPVLNRQMSVENTTKIIPEDKIREIYKTAYADALESQKKEAPNRAEEFIAAWKSMNFEGLERGLVYNYSETPELRKLFSEIENVTLPEENSDIFAWLSKFADENTVPERFKFKSWNEALRYDVSRGTGIQGGKQRTYEFFKKHLGKSERAKFLKNEYGIGGVGEIGYNQDHDAKGLVLEVIIKGELQKRLFSWEEVAEAISIQIMEGVYYKEENNTQSKNTESTLDQSSLTHADNEETPKVKSSRAKKEKWNIAKSKGEVMSAQEFSRLYGRDFDEREFPIWAATDWQGNIDLSKLNADDLQYMEQSGNYICKKLSSGEPEWTHKVLFTTGDIYAKIEEQKKFLSEAEDNPVLVEMYNKNIELLEASKKNKLNMEHIHFGLKSTLAEEFIIPQYDGDGNFVNLNLQESFILWAQGHTLASRRYRNEIDFATANISREELGEELSFYDIIDYIDGKPVKADAVRGYRTYRMTEEEKKAEKAERKKEADLKRQARADVANKLFDRYLHEGLELETIKQLEEEYNRRFNSYIIPDYSKLPLFVDGMSAYKGNSKFKLYNQQIKGISFLCNKGNGLLAYDVGVGKTAAGIVATVNQIQTERSKRPLIIVPNQVYSKWYIDIKQLFPNVKVNDLYNFNKESVEKYIDPENPHKLNIPENSISLCTYEALKNITFTDESCENELYQDFANLLSADMDGSDRENAESSDKIKGIIGSASHVKDESYYFFEECGFDNLTVDEAHNFKNLWVVPRPKKKGQSNEYAGIPSGKPSARALKMYGMTQLVQQHNDNRNVFMLTATPFTNSPTEVYSMLSYIGRERLHRAGIKSLRSFFDQFAQTKQELGVTSKGEIDTKQVMKNWKELPALQSILTEFIDKVDGEEAHIIRPHKFTHVKPLDMSELQLEMREMDEARMAEVKEGNSAAVIVAMNNMRLSCVAPALANPEMYEGLELPPLSQLVETSPKLKFVCDAIIDMYKDNPEKGQFMYVPLGKESHGIIKDYLVQHGIPKEAVEIINGDINNTPEKKEKITGKFNDVKDKLKIIIGGRNTAEGIDLNGNSFVMYNCSLGWNPSETIQAEGRIWRQNNMQGHVHIVYPVMNDSIDSVLYQKHDEKISRIDELWSYKGDSLNVEDINPEDLKLDLIKDPNKKAKLILEEETKDVKAELSKLNLKIKDFDEIIEKRKQLTLDFGTTEEDVQRYEKQIQDYKDRNLEVPEWIKLTLKNYKKDLEKQQYQKSNIQNKLYSWNLKTEEDEAAYIHNLNEQKKACEEKIHNIEKSLPEILQKLVVERMEQKIMEYPVTKQREIEIKTDRHNKMLAEMLKSGDITQEEHDLYKAAGYEKYEKWLNGEIESLEEKPLQEIVENDNQQSRVVEDNTSKVTDEYGFEVFGEEASDKQEEIKKAVEAIPSEQNDSEKMEKLKSATENAKKIVGANTISTDPSDLFFGFTDDDLFVKSPDNDKDELVVKSPEQLYFNFDNDDSYLTPDQLSKAEQERDKIVLPVLNDKESGMYKAFKDFSQHGIFDIVGTKIDMKETANGTRISPTGWKQLHAAMNIYRNKQFETFRYVLVDRHNGRIKDQLSVCSYMPNVCKVSDSEGKTLENVLTRAEETDCLIVAVHNHPSGNVQESNYDREATKSLEKSCLRNDGLQRFAGHIILDHDNFNIYKPHQGWKVHKDEQMKEVEDELINKDFAFTDTKIHSTGQLLNVAKSINETNNWNDNFVPVLFVNADCNISGLKYYDKSFFNKESQVIRNELQFSAIEAGAVNIFPVVTEALTNKLNGADRFLMEERMKELVLQNVFTDAVLTDSTIVEKNNLPDRSSLFNDFLKLTKPNIETTWEHKINPSLFAQMKMGTLKVIQDEELEKKPQQDLSHLKKASGMGY